jgi:hypothetical protein
MTVVPIGGLPRELRAMRRAEDINGVDVRSVQPTKRDKAGTRVGNLPSLTAPEPIASTRKRTVLIASPRGVQGCWQVMKFVKQGRRSGECYRG